MYILFPFQCLRIGSINTFMWWFLFPWFFFCSLGLLRVCWLYLLQSLESQFKEFSNCWRKSDHQLYSFYWQISSKFNNLLLVFQMNSHSLVCCTIIWVLKLKRLSVYLWFCQSVCFTSPSNSRSLQIPAPFRSR